MCAGELDDKNVPSVARPNFRCLAWHSGSVLKRAFDTVVTRSFSTSSYACDVRKVVGLPTQAARDDRRRRFVSTGTIEEKVFQRQLSKEGLQNIVDDKEEVGRR